MKTNKVVKAALVETNIGGKNGIKGIQVGGAKKKTDKPGNTRMYIDIFDRPVCLPEGEDFTVNPDIRYTTGVYSLRYIPRELSKKKYQNATFPFTLISDITRVTLKLAGWEHFKIDCQEIPEIDWLRRNTNISKEMFDLAKRYPNMRIPIAVDFVEYEKKLKKKYPDCKNVFIVSTCDPDIYQKYMTILCEDRLPEIERCQMSFIIAKEMKQNLKEQKHYDQQ